MEPGEISVIGVCGAGTMGAGIAQQAAASGFRVRVLDVSDEAWERGLRIISRSLERMVERGKISPENRQAILKEISYSTDPASLSDADFVIEAVFEELGVKRELFAQLENVCRLEVVFGSNTSSLSITELAAATSRPDRVVGMHFMNPVPVMQLVELIPALQTSAETVAVARQVAERMGKVVVMCKDAPGFIVNRILNPMIIDAVRVWDAGVATAKDIDTAMRLGANLPMGPLELADLIGIDICYNIANILYEYTREPRFSPPDAMRRMIKAGYLGRKTGKGFYDYGEET